MQQVTHSPLLQALGYAILNSLWQFALLWLLYVSINTLWKMSSHQKYVSGLVLQIAGFTWFIGTIVFYYSQCVALADTIAQQPFTFDLAAVNTSSTLKEKVLMWILQTEQLLPYLSMAYLGLLVFLLTKWLRAYKFTQAVRNNGLQKIDVEWRLFVQQLSFKLGIKRDVKIYLSDFVKTPLTIGFFKPLILIPLASINHLSAEQMEAVILHELAHIKRFDYLLNLFLAAIEAAMFFNPFMQLISIQIKRERENCCDDWVLQFEYSATSYARALLQIASNQPASPAFALKATDNKQALLNRIKRMIERKEKTFFNYRHQLLALIVMTTVLSTLALFSRKNNVFSVNTKGVLTPLVAKVDHPLFNPVFFFLNADTEVDSAELNMPIKDEEAAISIDEPQLANVDNVEVIPDAVADAPKPAAAGQHAPPAINIEHEDLNDVQEEALAIAADDPEINEIRVTRAAKDREHAERQIKKITTAVLSNKAGVQVNKQQVLRELETVLLQLNDIKLQKDLDEVYSDATKNYQKSNRVYAETIKAKKESWKVITNEIQQRIDQAKNEVLKLNTNNFENLNFSFTMPEVINMSPQEPHFPRYSFEFTEEPGIKLVATKVFTRVQRQNKKATGCPEVQQEKVREVPPTPARPATPARRAMVIRI